MEASVSDQVLAACAEFPNDNPGLHRGAIWYGAELGGRPVCERPEGPPLAVPAMSEPEPPPGPPVEALVEPPTEPTPPVIEADDETDDIEIVEHPAFDDAIEESPLPPEVPPVEAQRAVEATGIALASAVPAAPESSVEAAADPFVMLVAVLEDVARSAGAGEGAMTTLLCVLGRTRLDASAPDGTDVLRSQALAWQGILRGESEDFAACGSGMLDEWCAALVAGILGQPVVRADGLKRELRRRGVAAFGLVERAA
jgi:hypothetical protein